MSYELILFTLGFFVLTLVFHISIQKSLKTQKIIQLLFINFFVFPIIIFIFIVIAQLIHKNINWLELLSGLLLYLALASAYIQTFPAIQTFAPTLRIVYELGKFPAEGLSEADILKLFPTESMLDDGLDHLVKENLLSLKDNFYIITSKGTLMASLFIFLRKIYGLNKGVG